MGKKEVDINLEDRYFSFDPIIFPLRSFDIENSIQRMVGEKNKPEEFDCKSEELNPNLRCEIKRKMIAFTIINKRKINFFTT